VFSYAAYTKLLDIVVVESFNESGEKVLKSVIYVIRLENLKREIGTSRSR
jgi:hypothetical protein